MGLHWRAWQKVIDVSAEVGENKSGTSGPSPSLARLQDLFRSCLEPVWSTTSWHAGGTTWQRGVANHRPTWSFQDLALSSVVRGHLASMKTLGVTEGTEQAFSPIVWLTAFARVNASTMHGTEDPADAGRSWHRGLHKFGKVRAAWRQAGRDFRHWSGTKGCQRTERVAPLKVVRSWPSVWWTLDHRFKRVASKYLPSLEGSAWP